MTNQGPSVELPERLCLSGRWFTKAELKQVIETCRVFQRLSRRELTLTLCEHLDWRRPNGAARFEACAKALRKLEEMGLAVVSPARKRKQARMPTVRSARSDAGEPLECGLADVSPIRVEPAAGKERMKLWRELVSRWHYLGYRQAFGARLYYFIWSERLDRPLGCMLYSAAAWKVGCRDELIGWDKASRTARLHLVVNHSRHLILPWLRIRNLSTKALSLSVRRVAADRRRRYAYEPVLLEAFVDRTRNFGTTYRAANWRLVGRTAGTSRTYRVGDPLGTVKDVYLYPLRSDFGARLRGEEPS